MKPIELLLVAIADFVAVTITYFIAKKFEGDATGISQVVGSIVGVYLAVWFYQSRNPDLAPAKIKAIVGATLATVVLIQGLIFQSLFHWILYPDIAIGIPIIGAFIFAFVLWNSFGKSVIAVKHPKVN
ncbi:hypothetical protein EON80_10400 [bacterium]|nr:MAG: hypothetical protein EON80_10400 [bacterium]